MWREEIKLSVTSRLKLRNFFANKILKEEKENNGRELTDDFEPGRSAHGASNVRGLDTEHACLLPSNPLDRQEVILILLWATKTHAKYNLGQNSLEIEALKCSCFVFVSSFSDKLFKSY